MENSQNCIKSFDVKPGEALPGFCMGRKWYNKALEWLWEVNGSMEEDNLFAVPTEEPLAARLRPRTLDEFVGQKHLLDPGKVCAI